MIRSALLAAIAAILAAAPVHAQQTIQPGQTVGGRLQSTDPTLGDGSHYDQYVYRGGAGDRIVITLRSADFDAFLHWGTLRGGTFESIDTDDDGAGGTDSRIEATVGASGTHVIRVNSLGAGETGAYTLAVERAGGSQPRPAPSAEAVPIAPGQTVRGRLESGDPVLDDGSHYDQYVYQGRAGDRIVVTMRSADFDAYLHWGTLQGGSFTRLESDDDGAGGTDARLQVTVGASGMHVIRANSLSAGRTGEYTLSVESAGAESRPTPGGRTLRAGQTVNGRLSASDPRLGDDSHYHQYLYEGRAGEQLLVTLTSGDFDAFLRWGRMEGGRYTHIGFDDDGAGGTNARLQVTLDRAGTYAFQANTFAAGQTGSYTLSVESAEAAPAGLPAVTLGQTVSGRLDASDPKLPDDSHYDLYLYRGRPGEQVLVTLRSPDFDAYLAGGRMVGGRFEAEQRDDDSGGGTDAQLVGTVGQGGVLAIQANSLSARQTGRYTLTVEAAGGGARPAPGRPAPSGAATIAAGQTLRGTLARGDRMLSDSSYFDEYVYRGSPGERIEIVLQSADFDTYLRWGRLADGRFTEEANDDDGGGGTNSRLVATVGGSGTYAIHANAFGAGETGSYTLTVRAAGAPATRPAEAERAPSSLAGKWIHAYAEPRLPRHRPLGDRMKQARALEGVVDELNRQFPLPRNVDVRMDQCGRINAFYSPRQASITFCYELLEHLANTFARGAGEWTQQQREAVEGAYSFIMMHEVGHALIHQLDLPVTGREEDAVDQLAAITLISSGEKGARAALNGVLALQDQDAAYGDADFAGEHSLGPVRLFNVMCWVYGSDTQKYAWLVAQGTLPRDRAVRCPGEYERMSKAWQRILEPHIARS